MKFVSVAISTSLLLFSATSFAQSAPMTPAKSTTAVQASNKGEMSEPDKLTAEKQKANSDQFAKLDTSKDGNLSMAEFNAMPNRGKDFGSLDGDKDGGLTATEFAKQKMQ